MKKMKARKVKTLDEKIDNRFEEVPHTFIQWKGTDVCMDVYCKCGHTFHIDGYFMYSVECPECSTVYACETHIELIEITK